MAHRNCFLYIFVLLSFKQELCNAEYRAAFSSGAESCKNFDNDVFKAEKMVLGQKESEDEDGAGYMCIEGSLELTKDVGEGVMISIDIDKETDAGTEPMFSVLMGICECLKEKDAPWTPVFESMGIESCPIEKGTYAVKDMTIDLDFAKDMLSHEFVGEYDMAIKMVDEQKQDIACYNMGMSIEEV